MGKLLKFLKPYAGAVVAIICILVVQAFCVLSLPTYSSDMPVDEICSMMTYEEAGNVIVPLGTCKGWAMSQVADRRPASLKWYINGYSGNDNILRAAATIMQASLDEMQRAS